MKFDLAAMGPLTLDRSAASRPSNIEADPGRYFQSSSEVE
jgi:hypothetical protein